MSDRAAILNRYSVADKYWAISLGAVPTMAGGTMNGVWIHGGYLNVARGSVGCLTVLYASNNQYIPNLLANAAGMVNVKH